MREIKFRAWDVTASRFINLPEGDLIAWHGPSNWRSFYLLEQFTGLHDKEKREIYEGDIVDLGGNTFFVEYYVHHAGFVFTRIWNKNGDKSSMGMPGVNSVCSIIGNIHETPGLLNSPLP